MSGLTLIIESLISWHYHSQGRRFS